MVQFNWPNAPAEIKRQIAALISGFRSLTGDGLRGVYLHGSLATGCFNPLRSDLDLLVVTAERMTVEAKHDLARLILVASKNPAPLEISFLAFDDLHPWRHPTPFDFHFSEDWRASFERALADGDWRNWNARERFDTDLAAHITVLNNRGVCLFGAPITEIFPPIPERDFIDSILEDVLGEKFGLASAPGFPVYAVLNACRTLAFLKTAQVLSKAEGGDWALENLPAEFRRIIRIALEEYRAGRNDETVLKKENLAGFADFMKNEIERAKPALSR